MKLKSNRRVMLLAAGCSLLAASSAHAQSGTWDVDANGLWGTNTNWLSNIIATGSGNTANFTNDITADRTVSLDGDRTLTNVVFGDSDTATAGSWILDNNGTATNNLILAGTTPTITVNSLGTGKTATISAIIEGTAGLTKDGTGILILSGVNTYTGTTTVNAGQLRWGVNNALGSGDLTINSGGSVNVQAFAETVGTLRLNRGTINISGAGSSLKTGAGGFITTGGTVNSWPGIGLGGNFVYNTDSGNETTANIASVDFNGAGRTFTIADGAQAIDVDITTSLYSNSAGNHNFIKAGAGTMRISSGGPNPNYNLGSGTTSIQNGVLLLNKSASQNAVGGTGLVTVGDGTGAAGSAILRYDSTGGNDQIVNNAITILSDGLFDLNGKNETTSGALTHSTGGSITTGVGTLSLGNATNTISGASTVTGNLTFSGTAATNLTIGGTASINGTTTFSGAAGAGITATGTPQIQGTLALGTANRTISVGTNNTLSVGAQITGSTGTLTKSGAGILTLTGNNTYTGAITVSAGKLVIDGNNSAATGIVSVANLATLGGGGTVGGATTINAGGIVSPGNSIGTLSFSGNLTINGTYLLETASVGLSDLLDVNGILSLGAASVLDLDSLSSLVPTETYVIADYASGSLSGFFSSVDSSITTTHSVAYDYNSGTQIALVPIPEPSTLVLGGLALLGFAGAGLRKRRLAK